jgi:hypothetical protein
MAAHGVAALGIVAVGRVGEQHRKGGFNRLGQAAWRSLA